MSLINAALVVAPTSIAPTGGTALTFASFGSPAPGQVNLFVPADTDLRTRRSMQWKVKLAKPKADAPNGYTQHRVSFTYYYPIILANGKITVNSSGGFASFDVETSQTQIQQLIDVGAQGFSDADFVPVFKTLSIG